MAFATTNVQVAPVGNGWRLTGEWTGAVGDAAGTVSVGGARVTAIAFNIQDATSQEDRPVPTSVSTDSTTGLSTVTVYNSQAVATGRFSIEYV